MMSKLSGAKLILIAIVVARCDPLLVTSHEQARNDDICAICVQVSLQLDKQRSDSFSEFDEQPVLAVVLRHGFGNASVAIVH